MIMAVPSTFPLSDKVSVKGISKQKRQRQNRNRDKKKWKTKNPQDGDLEDALPPPPIPPYTIDMFIPATVSSTSTASSESTTVDDVIVTGSVFGDDSVNGTPNMAHCRTITFTATIESTNIDLAPPIPPHTNKMYILEHQSSACAKNVPLSDSLMRGCFDREEHIAEKGSDTESMLAQNEDAETEVDRDADCRVYADDTLSETSCDIGFPPPIPRRTQDMFCVQNFDSSDCTAGHITVMPNPSYMGVHKATV